MKTLFLLRHAQAAPAQGHSDYERVLTAHGQDQAAALGRAMRQRALQPDMVYCSSARRTRQTLGGLASGLEEIKTHYAEEIYCAPAHTLLHMIQGVEDDLSSLLLVAHNPGIYELAVMLSDDHTRLSAGYAPGTLSVLACPCDQWADLRPGQNRLSDYLDPSLYCPGMV